MSTQPSRRPDRRLSPSAGEARRGSPDVVARDAYRAQDAVASSPPRDALLLGAGALVVPRGVADRELEPPL